MHLISGGFHAIGRHFIGGFNREDFQSPLDAIISTFCVQKKTNDHLRWQFFLPKESP